MSWLSLGFSSFWPDPHPLAGLNRIFPHAFDIAEDSVRSEQPPKTWGWKVCRWHAGCFIASWPMSKVVVTQLRKKSGWRHFWKPSEHFEVISCKFVRNNKNLKTNSQPKSKKACTKSLVKISPTVATYKLLPVSFFFTEKNHRWNAEDGCLLQPPGSSGGMIFRWYSVGCSHLSVEISWICYQLSNYQILSAFSFNCLVFSAYINVVGIFRQAFLFLKEGCVWQEVFFCQCDAGFTGAFYGRWRAHCCILAIRWWEFP